jgi:hypothetical protein
MFHRLLLRFGNIFPIIQFFSSLKILLIFWCLLFCMSQELQYNQESGFHFLDSFPENVDVGTYVFVLEVFLYV